MTGSEPDLDDALKSLGAAMQVEPSRAFADGVRARVNRSRANIARVWWGLAAAASVGVATMTLWPATYAPSDRASVKVAVTPVQTAAPAVPGRAPESGVAMALAAPPAVPRRQATAAHAMGAHATITAIASEPQLEVITNQGAVLRAIWADYGGRPLVVAEAELVAGISATAPIAVNPIVVPPIVVVEMGKEPGAAGANPIIRRAEATKETR
ncbi:MAG TPA: hypothetical protein VMZ90_01395 [Vicinamibacterales bacterium]|nr:hypothetical protein [Vicinamibacterales bacterium]